MRILGIDPGSSVTGYGVVERGPGRLVHVAHGTLRPPRDVPLAYRLDHLYRTIAEVIALHAPDCVAVEQVFVAASPRSALVLGQARGAILAAVAARGLPVNEYTPARIKRSVTGNGRASKRQVKFMVKRLLASIGFRWTTPLTRWLPPSPTRTRVAWILWEWCATPGDAVPARAP